MVQTCSDPRVRREFRSSSSNSFWKTPPERTTVSRSVTARDCVQRIPQALSDSPLERARNFVAHRGHEPGLAPPLQQRAKIEFTADEREGIRLASAGAQRASCSSHMAAWPSKRHLAGKSEERRSGVEQTPYRGSGKRADVLCVPTQSHSGSARGKLKGYSSKSGRPST